MATKSIATLRRRADKLFQEVVKREKPISVVSGLQTEVIHHFINKGHSNNLRYDDNNGVPLTSKEHTQHHRSGDPAIVIAIKEHYGDEWFEDLQKRRRIIRKFNKGYLKEVIESLVS